MAEAKENPLMEKIVSLCKRRGFIYQSSEIYGGINGFWDYGPLGAELKRNVKELWWNTMTRQRDDVVGLEATIIMSPQIWKASGHVDTFSDPMCDCLLTGKRFRADQIEAQTGIAYHFDGARDVTYEKFNELHQRKSLSWMAGGVPDDEEGRVYKKLSRDCQEIEERAGRNLALLNALEFVQRPMPETDASSKDSLKHALTVINDALCNAGSPAGKVNLPFSVLLPPGKPRESALKLAEQFYIKRGVKNPEVVGERSEKIEAGHPLAARFNPDQSPSPILTEPRPFNLMFKTYVGPVESEEGIAYLRPETAQAIFAQFKNVLDSSRVKVPFGIAQIGKAFRNEVTPRNYTFRSREFEQMELEFFIKPDEAIEAISGRVASAAEIGNRQLAIGDSDWGWEAWHKYWVEERIKFYESIGLPRTTLVEYWQKPEELAHYARATVDILYKFPFSKRDAHGELTGEELEGVAARSDFDLSQHARFSGKPMGVFDDELRAAWGKLDDAKKAELSNRYYEARLKYLTKTGVEPAKAEKVAREDAEGLAKGQYIPHVIEPSAGVDRLILALICKAYHEDQMPDEKGKQETRVVLRFHPRVAPIKVAVLPLLKNKPELVKKAQAVRDLLRPHMNVFYDDGGAIGRRYRRQDEIGTPFCVTIDFDTLGEKPELLDTVTLRYRDDGRQERVTISELLPLLLEKIR